MSEWWLPGGVAVAALVLTYLFCVRPMRRGRCAMPAAGSNSAADLDRDLAEARTELTRLRGYAHSDAQAQLDTSPTIRNRVPEEEER